MRTPLRKMLLVLVCLLLVVCIAAVWFLAGSANNSRVSITYLGTVDGSGHWKLRFGVTNVGDSIVFTSKQGEIEVFNHTNVMSTGATAPMTQLAPGQGHLVEAVLSETQMKSIDGKWRYTCLYGSDELRSRIYRWQWGSNGPGARVNWLIPQKLKGMPLTVKGTSDWIEPTK